MCFRIIAQSLLLLLAAIQVARGQVAKSNNGFRIIGGEPAEEDRYKFFVRLHQRGKFVCGGTLVQSNAVVTAAHCVAGGRASDFTIHAGTVKLSEAGITRKVQRINLPRQYNARSMHYDVAVLITDSAFPASSTTVASLRTSAVPSSTSCLILGHGLKTVNGKVAEELQEAWVPTMDLQTCRQAYRYAETLTSTMLCASVPGKKDACSGDSGGPMMCGNQLSGIVSWGIGCAEKKYPGVYTDVSKVATYIKQQLNPSASSIRFSSLNKFNVNKRHSH